MFLLIRRICHFFEGITQAFPEDQTVNADGSSLWGFVRAHMRGYERVLLMSMVIGVIYAVMEVSLFAFLGELVDWLVKQNRETFLQDEFWGLLIMGIMLLVAMPLVGVLGGFLQFQSVMSNLPMAARWRSHKQLLRQDIAFYQDDFAGRLATKVMQTSLSIRDVIIKVVEVFVYIGVTFFSMLLILWAIDFWLMLPMLVWALVYSSLLTFFLPRLRKVSQQQSDARSLMTGRVVDAYSNIATVKLFAHTEREAEYAKSAMGEFLHTSRAQMRWVNALILSVEFCNYVLIFVVAGVSIWLWLDAVVGAGALAIAIAMALRLNGMAHWMMFEMSGLFEHLGTVADGMKTLTTPSLVKDVEHAESLCVDKGEITFAHVDFSYAQRGAGSSENLEDDRVLRDLSLDIKAGERIGVVGRSGAGKSSLVNALLRFYDVERGNIIIDGQNIATVTQESLRENIAMVAQDTGLLHRSVRENILYGKPDASDEELMSAIRQAKVDDFIGDLSDADGNTGLDAQVGERGVKLSGGQRQRIAIARVLLKNAPIVVLDEATSALDSEVETAIQESLELLTADKTVIAIAHRLSTIAAMDRLIVLDKGEIIEQGTHTELLEQGGLYAKLWAHQTGGFLQDLTSS